MAQYRVIVNGLEVDKDYFTREYVAEHTTSEVVFVKA